MKTNNEKILSILNLNTAPLNRIHERALKLVY